MKKLNKEISINIFLFIVILKIIIKFVNTKHKIT